MDYAAAVDFLYGLEHGAVKLGLERIERAVASRGHPESGYRTVHVAGTNGKGSTCAMIAAILEAAGYRTGLLTSPHLIDFRERIRLRGRLLAREDVAALTAELVPLCRDLSLSYFEATTLLAFEAFARGGVDVAVIEVGMGGRLDATNVIQPELAVVTGIDFDHMKSLGATLAAIAGEKAGIMKASVPLLVGACPDEAENVFVARGRTLPAPVHRLADHLALSGVAPIANGTRYRRSLARRGSSRPREIRLCGEHQARNALLAEAAARLLAGRGFTIDETAIRRGLAAAHWPGRFERVDRAEGPPVILDVAHNPQGARTLAETYARWMEREGEPELIAGMLADKDHWAFFAALRRLSSRLHLVPLDSPRAGPIGDLAAAARQADFDPRVHASMDAALAAASRAERPVVVTGSFLTIEAAMRALGVGAREELFDRRGRRWPARATTAKGEAGWTGRTARSASTSAERR